MALSHKAWICVALTVLLALVVGGGAWWQVKLTAQRSVDLAREVARSAVSAASGEDTAGLSTFFRRPVTASEAASMAALIPKALRSDLKGFEAPFWNSLDERTSVVQVQHVSDESFAIDVMLEKVPTPIEWRVLGMRSTVAK